jgi:NAD-dependent SIR2 family protein deacetylase
MSSAKGITGFMSNEYQKVKELLLGSQAVVIGAGSGLSTAAGFEYGGKTFQDHFAYMSEKYDVHDMYEAGFAPFKSPEEFWGYWAEMITLERYQDGAKPLYRDLLKLVSPTNYFVLTTNVDHQFQKAGFDKSRLFYTQGDYGLFQCSVPCHNKTYDNEAMIREMVSKMKDHKIPTELIPTCPICHKPMTLNLRMNDSFVEDEGWKTAQMNYQSFLDANKAKKVLYLELGVGENSPAVIKYPFWAMTIHNPLASYVVINKEACHIPDPIVDRSVMIQDDLTTAITNLLKA